MLVAVIAAIANVKRMLFCFHGAIPAHDRGGLRRTLVPVGTLSDAIAPSLIPIGFDCVCKYGNQPGYVVADRRPAIKAICPSYDLSLDNTVCWHHR